MHIRKKISTLRGFKNIRNFESMSVDVEIRVKKIDLKGVAPENSHTQSLHTHH